VQLVDSSQGETSDAAGASAPTTGNTGCFGSDYLFNVAVTFGPAVPTELEDEDPSVPSSLGGGA